MKKVLFVLIFFSNYLLAEPLSALLPNMELIVVKSSACVSQTKIYIQLKDDDDFNKAKQCYKDALNDIDWIADVLIPEVRHILEDKEYAAANSNHQDFNYSYILAEKHASNLMYLMEFWERLSKKQKETSPLGKIL